MIFVAPTKPLVAQQIEACHRTCGIPGSDAAELTREVSKAARSQAVSFAILYAVGSLLTLAQWQEKRVFYMTPQTLINDLIRENCDPSNIILIVVGAALAFLSLIIYFISLSLQMKPIRVKAITLTHRSCAL